MSFFDADTCSVIAEQYAGNGAASVQTENEKLEAELLAKFGEGAVNAAYTRFTSKAGTRWHRSLAQCFRRQFAIERAAAKK
jgi:hypothetical protein